MNPTPAGSAVEGVDLADFPDAVAKAMRRAYSLGQTYWQQADSEYTSQHRKADETDAKFNQLVSEIRQAVEDAISPSPVAAQQEPVAWQYRVNSGGAQGWSHWITADKSAIDAHSDRDLPAIFEVRALVVAGAAAAAPSPVVEPTPAHSAMEAAARWVEARRDAYVDEHGNSDPDTGAVEFPGDGAEYVFELDEIAEGLRALAPLPEPQVDDLAHTVRRLAHALRKAAPDNDLPAKALDYLKRHGLQGSPLRGAVVEPGAQAGREAVREHAPCKGMACGITRTDQEHSLECQAEHAAAIAGGRFVKEQRNG